VRLYDDDGGGGGGGRVGNGTSTCSVLCCLGRALRGVDVFLENLHEARRELVLGGCDDDDKD
jgi:hypothetical protein